MDNAEVTAILAEIASLLEVGHEEPFALSVRNALCGPAQALEEFLWGGVGSIVDQAFDGRSEHRKELENLLIQLGRIQLSYGNANVRTKNWVEAFEKWHQREI